jgi:PAS domain S-box-containing protein
MHYPGEFKTTDKVQADFAALVEKLDRLPADVRADLLPEMERLRASVGALSGEDQPGSRALEENARVALAKYETLFAAFPMGITVSDASGQVLETNPEAERLLGVSIPEHISRKIDSPEWQIIRPDGSPMPPEEYASTRALNEKRRVENVEMGILRPSGEVTWINVSATPIPLEGYGVVVTYGDITERKQAEQALAFANARFQSLLENLPLGVVLTDTQGKFLVSNPANAALFGGSGVTGDATGPVGGYTLHYPDGKLIPAGELPLVLALQDGKSTRNVELVIRRENGEEVSILANCSPVRGADGSIQGAVAAMQDITKLKQVELQQRLLELREQERMEFARELHDGPIQDLIAILFNLQFAKEGIEETIVKQEFEQVGQGVQKVIRNLRDVCNSLRPPALLRFGLARSIRVHAEDFHDRHPEIAVQLDLREDTSLLPENISLALYRIYQESINNLLHHARATRVQISLTRDGERIMLRVADNGVGFAVPRDLSTRGHTGHFGLVGMKERSEIIKGELCITSAPGQGTEVRVAVPVRSGHWDR